MDHLSEEDLSPSDISDIDENQDTSSTIFISRNKKENWSSTPHTNDIGRTAACNIYREKPGPSRYANRNAIQFLIHSDYFLETICCKMCVTGQMLKDYLYTKTSGLL